MANRLQHETSPYLLQHANNPVNWFPWGEEAFARAKEADKPVFLSIGYSTCHWCHVMARESFEDAEIAELLNRHFIAVKVDKEERPDIDAIYMRACVAFTGSGGWPTSIFMTAEQKPFFAGTYFPKQGRGGMLGLRELLIWIAAQWRENRSALLEQAEALLHALQSAETADRSARTPGDLPRAAYQAFSNSYDAVFGGFGHAPKFPAAHNLLFLLAYARVRQEPHASKMAEKTLFQLCRGGIFDQIGGGFCRYSTDRRFLAPHFEKMLYDNALLVLALCAAGRQTDDKALGELFLHAAERTGDYVLREMTDPEGGFYSAQDADSEGQEGRYYLLTPQELVSVLGQTDGEALNRRYDITPTGNFEGKSIPNLLGSDPFDRSLEPLLPKVLHYRRQRAALHTDKKCLTAWNGLMIAALCVLYRATRNETFLMAAQRADRFLKSRLLDGKLLYASWAAGRRGAGGFLDDYAALAMAQLALYGATLAPDCLQTAEDLCRTVQTDFSDPARGGFYFSAERAAFLLLRPKEVYDGAMPSGNSLMAWNLVRLAQITQSEYWQTAAERQLGFLTSAAADTPAGNSMALLAGLSYEEPVTVTAVLGTEQDRTRLPLLPLLLPPEAAIRVLTQPTEAYRLLDGKTTCYVCKSRRCLPPVNDPETLRAVFSEA